MNATIVADKEANTLTFYYNDRAIVYPLVFDAFDYAFTEEDCDVHEVMQEELDVIEYVAEIYGMIPIMHRRRREINRALAA